LPPPNPREADVWPAVALACGAFILAVAVQTFLDTLFREE
jgi:hypothetical protein